MRVSLSFSLVETVDRLVTVSRQRASIARCIVRSVKVGVGIRSIVVKRVGFRLSQAERGYGENYDLNKENLLFTVGLFSYKSYHTLHDVCLTVV